MLPPRSVTAKVLNVLGHAAPRVTFDFDAFARKAEKRAGAKQWDGISEFDDAYRWMIEELRESKELSYVGAVGARLMLVQGLTKRLQIEQYRRTHSISTNSPPVAAIIVSPPRTGTTLLYNLLYATGLFRAPLYWELINLASRFDVPTRLRRAQRTYRRRERLMLLRGIHDINPSGPEECANLLLYTGLSTVPGVLFRLPQYRSRLARLDRGGSHLRRLYDFHALALNVIAHERETLAQSPPDDRPWLLKAPAHASFISCVAAKYPDASLIVNLRSPSSFVSSMCALRMATQQAYTRNLDPRQVGEESLNTAAWTYGEMARWSQRNGQRLRAVEYDDLVADPMSAAKRVIEGLGVAYTEEHTSRAEAWLKERLKEHKPLRSTLEEYGLSREVVAEKLDQPIAEIRAAAGRVSSRSAPAPTADHSP